jgi:hypothetical protein
MELPHPTVQPSACVRQQVAAHRTSVGGARILRAAPLAVIALAASCLAPWSLAAPALAAAKKHRPHCTPRHHPHGCIKVPVAARRPRAVSQQGGPALTPKDAVNGGGIGGGIGQRGENALNWAAGQQTSTFWAYRCERFVEEAFGVRGKFTSARDAAKHLRVHRGGSPRSAPRGSVMLFAGDTINHGLGHIGLSDGAGKMISALTSVRYTDVAASRYWSDLYVGWADVPSTWPGRLPLPPDVGNAIGSEPVEILSPAFADTVSATVRLAARALNGGSVAFSAFYADDPGQESTLRWHFLGRATDDGGTQVLDWDTTAVPDQGNPTFGTVAIAAIAVDAAGNQTGVGDYRRVTVQNAAS